jgi:hypothetical protein cdiviTM7_00647
MKQTFVKKILVAVALVVLVSSGLAMPVSAANYGVRAGADAARGADQPTQLFGDGGIFQQITNIMLFIIGVLSVIMLIIGGLRYVISGGNKDAVTSAKNTILYAIVGLIVALLAYAAINFVINVFTSGGYGSGTNV